MDDVIQQTWIKVWLKANQCRGESRAEILGWIKTIAAHVGANMRRDSAKLVQLIRQEQEEETGEVRRACSARQQSQVEGLDDTDHGLRPTEQAAQLRDFHSWMKRSLNKLDQTLTCREKQVVDMLQQGISKGQIATQLSISGARVTQLLAQIQKKYSTLAY
jgi:RNA polymerase sigma factor (sigma-70 family)